MKKCFAALVAALVLALAPAAALAQPAPPSLDATRAQAQDALAQASNLRVELDAARAQANAAAEASRRALADAQAAQQRLDAERARLQAEQAQLNAERIRTEQVRGELAATAIEGARLSDALGDVTEAQRLGRRARHIDVYFIGFTPNGSVIGEACVRRSNGSAGCINSDLPLLRGNVYHHLVVGRSVTRIYASRTQRGTAGEWVAIPSGARRVVVSREAGIRYE